MACVSNTDSGPDSASTVTNAASDSDGNATVDAQANPAANTQPLSNQTAEADSVANAKEEISAQTATDSCYGNA